MAARKRPAHDGEQESCCTHHHHGCDCGHKHSDSPSHSHEHTNDNHPDKKRLTPDFNKMTIAIEHGDHIDYVHEGHLYHQGADGQWHECSLEVEDDLPDGCSHDFECAAHHDGSVCGPDCGHIAIPHGDHVDYLVEVDEDTFELHHPHGDHCDFHGTVKRAKVPPVPPPPKV